MIYAVVNNQESSIHNAKFFRSQFTARNYLAAKAKEIASRLGPHGFIVSQDKFSFYMGWEEIFVKWEIVSFDELDSPEHNSEFKI